MPIMPGADLTPVSRAAGDADRLRRAVETAGCRTLLHLDQTGSTMDAARQLVEAGVAPLPALVVADRQSAGRGRRGNEWWQPSGGLAATVVHDVGFLGGDSPPAAWSIACGVAVAEAIMSIHPGLTATVKWPNDVLVGERKLAGCLVETMPRGRGPTGRPADDTTSIDAARPAQGGAGAVFSGSRAVLFGIGVNTTGRSTEAPPELRLRVATLPDLIGQAVPREEILAGILPRLESLCREIAVRPAVLVERFEPLCALSGRLVALHTSIPEGCAVVRGRCLGIDTDGALRLLTERGVERFVSGSLSPTNG